MKNESLQGYALRLKEQIKEPGAVIVGVSFGGMLATEIAKTDPTSKVIIVSSNKIKDEFPKIFLTGKYLPVYKWLPSILLKKGTIIRSKFFSPKGEKQKKIFQQILSDTDTKFTKWAIYSILHWKNKVTPDNVIHIHGTSDNLLPYRLVKADYAIKNGTHLMIMNQYKEISELLKKLI